MTARPEPLSRDEAAAWLERARAACSLSAQGVTPFRLRGTIDLPQLTNQGPEGELSWTFVDLEHQLVDVRIDAHRSVRLRRGLGWVAWSVPETLPPGLDLIVEGVLVALDPVHALTLRGGDRLQGFRDSTGQVRLAVKREPYLGRTVVLDGDTARPVQWTGPFDVEWSGEVALGPIRWPAHVTVARASHVVAVLDLQRVGARDAVTLPRLEIPTGAVDIVDDEGLASAAYVEPRLVRRPPHRRSTAARNSGTRGQVTIRALVDERGRVSQAKIEAGMDPATNEHALQVVRANRYEPGRRDGEPTSA